MSAQAVEPDLTPYAGAAHAYLRNGWPALPLPRDGKFPPPRGYTGHAASVVFSATVQDWIDNGVAWRQPDNTVRRVRAVNLAVTMPATDDWWAVGFDVDDYETAPGKRKLGGDTMRALTADLGRLPRTVVSSSRFDTDPASGIRFFRVPAGTYLLGNLEDLGSGSKDVEVIQRHHRYAVVAPSVVKGRTYRLVDQRDHDHLATDDPTVLPQLMTLPVLPEPWVERLRTAAPAEPTAPGAAPVQLTEGKESMAVQRAKAAFLKAARRKDAGSRHDECARLVLRLVRMAEQREPGITAALTECRIAFVSAVTKDASRTVSAANSEFDRMIPGAQKMVAETPTPQVGFDPGPASTSPQQGTTEAWTSTSTSAPSEPDPATEESETPSWTPPTPLSAPAPEFPTDPMTPAPVLAVEPAPEPSSAAPATSIGSVSTVAAPAAPSPPTPWSASETSPLATSDPQTTPLPASWESASTSATTEPSPWLPSTPPATSTSVPSDPWTTPSPPAWPSEPLLPWQTPTSPSATTASEPSLNPAGVAEATSEPPPSWAPLDLATLLDADFSTPKASVWDVGAPGDPDFMLYRGAVHSVQGQPESWKSWVGLVASASCLAAGQSVLLIDSEEQAEVAVGRLLLLGTTREQMLAGLTIVHPEADYNAGGEWEAFEALVSRPYDLAVIDSVATTSGLSGVKENANDEMTQWFRDVPTRVAVRTGAAVVLTDHVAKPSRDAAVDANRYAIGAQAKLARVQVAFRCSVDDARPVPGGKGYVTLDVTKDRHGDLRQRGPIVEIAVDSTSPDRVVVTVARQTVEEKKERIQTAVAHRELGETARIKAGILRVLRVAAEGYGRTALVPVVRQELIATTGRGVDTGIVGQVSDLLVAEGILEKVRVGKADVVRPTADWIAKAAAAGLDYERSDGLPPGARDVPDVGFDPTEIVADHDEPTPEKRDI